LPTPSSLSNNLLYKETQTEDPQEFHA
jgi:hypothetical protein